MPCLLGKEAGYHPSKRKKGKNNMKRSFLLPCQQQPTTTAAFICEVEISTCRFRKVSEVFRIAY